MTEKHPLHLKLPTLQTSSEVKAAVARRERHSGATLPNDPSARIEAYMDRLEKVFLNPDAKVRKRNLELVRDAIYDTLIIKRENFPESYFDLQKRVARERGEHIEEIPQHVREQMIETAREDQKASLDAWMEYLTSDDAVYPAWFKWYAWTQVTKLSQFDKERGEFKRRTDSTVAPFPDIYREPLAQIADLYERVRNDNKDIEARSEFDKKFPSLYAELIAQSLATSMESREEVRGTWVTYAQGERGAAEKLFQSLEGKGTGWCTAGRSTAEAQIRSGDFHVYYTNDANGNPMQPRLAIRMEGRDRIGEVRGILPQQGVEPLLEDTLEAKLAEFGTEADAYRKKSSDMRLLTRLEYKTQHKEPLTRDELVFLYEINTRIEGFGYGRDPRIAELRVTRIPQEDAPIVLNCAPGEIAWSKDEYDRTPSQFKSYIGPLFEGIFQTGLEHIYTSFPEGGIRERKITIGGKDRKKLAAALKKAEIEVTSWAEDLMSKKEFAPSKKEEQANLVMLTVGDLGFARGATTDEVYAATQRLGLELCPPEVGPQLRLQYDDQPQGEYIYVGMPQITGSGGYPYVFYVKRDGDERWLRARNADPRSRWNADRRFVFRKSSLGTSTP